MAVPYIVSIDDAHSNLPIDGASHPKIIIYSGIIVAQDNIPIIETLSERLIGDLLGSQFKGVPIKWNPRDSEIQKFCIERSLCHKSYLKHAPFLRKEFIKLASFTLTYSFVSVILSHSDNNNVLRKTSIKNKQLCFSNLLEALSSSKINGLILLNLDWPDGGNRNLFQSVYDDAYLHHKDPYGNQLRCQPFCKSGFSQSSLKFSSTKSDRTLQLADILAGATDSLINAAIYPDRKNTSLSLASEIINLFQYGGNSDIRELGSKPITFKVSGKKIYTSKIWSTINSTLNHLRDEMIQSECTGKVTLAHSYIT